MAFYKVLIGSPFSPGSCILWTFCHCCCRRRLLEQIVSWIGKRKGWSVQPTQREFKDMGKVGTILQGLRVLDLEWSIHSSFYENSSGVLCLAALTTGVGYLDERLLRYFDISLSPSEGFCSGGRVTFDFVASLAGATAPPLEKPWGRDMLVLHYSPFYSTTNLKASQVTTRNILGEGSLFSTAILSSDFPISALMESSITA